MPPLLRHQLPKDYVKDHRRMTAQEHHTLVNSSSFRNYRAKESLFSFPGPDENSVVVSLPQEGTKVLKRFIFDKQFFDKILQRFSPKWIAPTSGKNPTIVLQIKVILDGQGHFFNVRNLVAPGLFGQDMNFRNGDQTDYRSWNLS